MFGLFGKSSNEGVISALFDLMPDPAPALEASREVTIAASGDFFQYGDGWGYGVHNGEKFEGTSGFGGNTLLFVDYWGLRAKSAELFERNLYARGVVRRLVTNIIVTGLSLESTPSEPILGKPEGSLDDWTDLTEERFEIWAGDPKLCDFEGRRTFGEIQQEACREALITGDVLVVQRMHRRLGVPQVQLIDGSLVQTPIDHAVSTETIIEHGVELDRDGRHLAYWVTQEDGSSKRIPAVGPRSGRRMAWLYYGSDKRMGAVRGQPILSLILQSVKEIDRFRDSAQRKAVVNSMVALFVTKETEGMGTRPIAGGATRRGSHTTSGEGGQGQTAFKTESLNPGLAIDRLAPNEKIQGFPTTGADQHFSDFEAGILQGIAWSLEIPPEILMLSFSSNYAASQAALHEFGMFLAKERARVGATFCAPFYSDWLIGEVLAGRVQADGFLDAWRDRSGEGRYAFSAWVQAAWNGQVKPSTDMLKQMKGMEMAAAMGFVSYDFASRVTTGTKWRNNIKKQKREREIAEAAGVPLTMNPAPEMPEESSEPDDEPPAKKEKTNEVAD